MSDLHSVSVLNKYRGQLHQICSMSLPQQPILDFIKHAIFQSNLQKLSYYHREQTSAPKSLAHMHQNIMLYPNFYLHKSKFGRGKNLAIFTSNDDIRLEQKMKHL